MKILIVIFLMILYPGSMSKVHRACLERWLAESAKNSCEICNYEYNTVRKPKVS